jgi:hypothetical protein
MSKRTGHFARERDDFYPTPEGPVRPLLPHLATGTRFVEPCAGDGALRGHLEAAGHVCVFAYDINPRSTRIAKRDALTHEVRLRSPKPFTFITNPPWKRDILHPLIMHLSDQAPTWLLFEADWAHTVQAVPFADRLRKIVSVGRVRWIAGSKSDGKDNCAWYLFDQPDPTAVSSQFFLRQPKTQIGPAPVESLKARSITRVWADEISNNFESEVQP